MSTTRCAVLLALAFGCGTPPRAPSPLPAPPVATADTVDTIQAATSAGPAVLPSPLEGDAMGVTIHRLSNGLTVYISTDDTTPSISSWIAVRSGSRHDPADSTGLAHYLEHMLFKGSGKLGTLDMEKEKPHLDRIAALYDELRAAKTPDEKTAILTKIDKETLASSQYSVPNEFDNLYASLGIDGVNAFTSDDQTVYIANVPSNRFDTWAQVEGERFADPQFRLFYPELESVYEEKNRSLDSPSSRIFQAMSLAMYPEHPYGTQPTIGLTEHLKTPAYGDMVRYFESWYRPNNMAIVLAGDITPERALPVLEKRFGGLQAKALPALPESSTEPPGKRQEIEVVAPGEQSIYLAWPTVAAGHADEVALEVMDLVVDNSATGLLNLELVLAQKLPRAGSFGQVQPEAGSWVLTGTARSDQSLQDVEKLLMGVVGKLKAGAFSQADLEAIVINSEISEKRRLESNGARVQKMTNAFIEGRSWADVIARQERMRAVTREDVMRVARTYITDAPVVVKRVRGDFAAPKVDKPAISAIQIDSSKESAYAREIKAQPAPALAPQWLVDGEHYERSTLPAGSLIAVTNERNDLFTVDYDFQLGERQERLLCFAMDLIERSGAGKRSPAQLQKELYAMGTSISFGCGERESSITISGIDRKLEDSLALMKEWLSAPLVEDGALEKLRANTISKRKDAMNEPSVIARALSQYASFGKRSSFLEVPSNKRLSSTSKQELVGLVAALPNLEHRTSYLGPRKSTEVKSIIALGKGHRAAKKVPAYRFRKNRRSSLFFVDQKVAQAQVRIAFPSDELPAEENVLASLFNQYVGGGMGGLVFQEIREARGLAYSAWAYYASSARLGDDSSVAAGLGTQADKTVEAVSTLLGLIVPLRVEATRFQTALASLDADYRKTRIGPRRRAATLHGWEDIGLEGDPRPERYEALHATSAEAMQDFANARTKVAPIVAITGDSSRIDLKALSKAASIARVKIIKVADLFGY